MARRPKFSDLVIGETEDFVAINKPAGMSSLHEREMDGSSVIELLEREGLDYQLCHRIDRDTSGVLLLSKSPEAYRHAAVQFEKRRVEKVYHCVVEGVHHFDSDRIEMPLAQTRSGRNSINYLKGKESVTLLTSLEHFGHYTLVEARPITGRMHQIRAHLSAVNAPLAGDLMYSGHWPYLSRLKKNFSQAKHKEDHPMIQRFALHAYSLSLPMPGGEELQVLAPYPKDFEVFVKLLKKYDTPS